MLELARPCAASTCRQVVFDGVGANAEDVCSHVLSDCYYHLANGESYMVLVAEGVLHGARRTSGVRTLPCACVRVCVHWLWPVPLACVQ